MSTHDLRQLTEDELTTKVGALEEDLFKIKFQHATAQLSDTSKIKDARRELARAKTILREKQLAAEQDG